MAAAIADRRKRSESQQDNKKLPRRDHSGREECGESQFQGSLWRATLSREAWMPIWGLSTESMSPGRLPVVAEVMEPSDGDGAGVRVFQGVTTRTDPSRTERLHPGEAQ